MLLDQSAILDLGTAKFLEGSGESFANLDTTSAVQTLFQSFNLF